jgi:hypothetical protein
MKAIIIDAILNIGIALLTLILTFSIVAGFTWFVTSVPYVGLAILILVALAFLAAFGHFLREGGF